MAVASGLAGPVLNRPVFTVILELHMHVYLYNTMDIDFNCVLVCVHMHVPALFFVPFPTRGSSMMID